jgi:hypothetical protein
VGVPSQAEHSNAPQGSPKTQNCNSLGNSCNNFDYISAICGNRIPEQNTAGGIFRKMTECALRSQLEKCQIFFETCITAWLISLLSGIQKPTVVYQVKIYLFSRVKQSRSIVFDKVRHFVYTEFSVSVERQRDKYGRRLIRRTFVNVLVAMNNVIAKSWRLLQTVVFVIVCFCVPRSENSHRPSTYIKIERCCVPETLIWLTLHLWNVERPHSTWNVGHLWSSRRSWCEVYTRFWRFIHFM